MKKIIIFAAVVMSALASCEKDTSDFAPNAKIFGSILDMETGEPIQQDIVNGSKIYFIEQGWKNPPVQEMVIRNDGSYRNNLFFAGDYKMILNRGNFIPTDTLRYSFGKGDNRRDFEVMPYIRVVDASITRVDNRVVAKFKLKQNTTNKVASASLFIHTDATVGYGIYLAEQKLVIDDQTDPNTEYTISIGVNNNPKLPGGKSYYFRIGALSSAGEAKHNYAPAVSIDI